MSIVRVEHNKNNPYVILNKKALEDNKLSWAAKGLWAYLMSRPDDWNVSVAHLSKIYEEKGGGARAIYGLLNELIENGYCERYQSNENGFGKVEYIVSEFKKCLPHCSQAHAPHADPLESTTTNKGIVLSKEEEQQQQPAAVFFDILKNVEIKESEKVWISKNYDEKTVKHAVAYATNPNTKIRTSLVQVIKWACEKKPDIPTSKEEETVKNKELAESIRKLAVTPKGCQFDILNKYVEIFCGGNTIPYILEYSVSGFKEKLIEALKKYGIRPNQNHFADVNQIVGT